MSEWKEEILIDCLESLIDYRGKTPKKSVEGIVTLSAKSVKMGKIDYTQAYYISPEEYQKFMVRGFPRKGDILMTTEAPLGCIAKLDRDNVSVAQRLLTLRGKKDILDNDYLMYYLMSRRGQYELLSRASGSTVQGIKRSEFENVQIVLPKYEEQKEIAKTLSNLDKKITLLREQNQTLEELAQTLFKRWFVEFEFPFDFAQGKPDENGRPYKSSGGKMVESELGEIPEEWRVFELKNLVSVKRGGSPRPIQDFLDKKGLPWVKISDATGSESPFLLKTKEFIKKEGLPKTVYLQKGSLILSNSATPGLPKFLDLDACIHDGWLYFPEINVINQNYMYLLFLHLKRRIVQQGSGSVFTNLKTDILKEQLLPVAPQDIIDSFSAVNDAFFEKIRTNTNDIQILTQLRDTLLPKLMSGEVRVKDI